MEGSLHPNLRTDNIIFVIMAEKINKRGQCLQESLFPAQLKSPHKTAKKEGMNGI